MYFASSLMLLALAAVPGIFAAPIIEPTADLETSIESELVARANTVTCKPKKNASKTKFIIDIDLAKAEVKVAGFGPGRSGDPHRYMNGEKLAWAADRSQNCNSKPLWEYPMYWVGSKQKAWLKNEKTSKNDPTPVRVVYANVNGGIYYCGIMIHERVKANNAAEPVPNNFLICT